MCRALRLPGLCFLALGLLAEPAAQPELRWWPREAAGNLARGLAADNGPEAPEAHCQCPGCDPDSLRLLQLRAGPAQPRRRGDETGEGLQAGPGEAELRREGNQTGDSLLGRAPNETAGSLLGHFHGRTVHVGAGRRGWTGEEGALGGDRGKERLSSVTGAFVGPRLVWGVFFLAIVMLVLVSAFVFTFSVKAHKLVCGIMSPAAFISLVFVLFLFLAFLPLWYLSGALIKEVIERFDVAFIGTDVSLDTVHFNPFSGHFKATDVRIYNPPDYATELLLQASSLSFDLGVASMILSLGKRAVADHISVNGVNITYERSWKSSNVADIMDYLNSGDRGDYKVTIHQVDVTNIRAQATSSFLNGVGMTLYVKDIHFADFTRKLGGMGVAGVVRIVLSTMLNSVLQAGPI